ncbi:MAG TPA: hypothetical protein VIT92_09945 [Burkholderiaceae bacterium]
MNALRTVWFALALRIHRAGWVRCVLAAVCIASIAGGAFVHVRLQQQTQQLRTERLQAERALNAARAAAAQPKTLLLTDGAARLAQFYGALGEPRYAEQQVKTLFALAAKNNLVLARADYKFEPNKDGRYVAYQISLPVKGSYGAIRQFAEQVLLAVPFASLDQLQFQREGITSAALEARMRLTVYLQQGQAATAVERVR